MQEQEEGGFYIPEQPYLYANAIEQQIMQIEEENTARHLKEMLEDDKADSQIMVEKIVPEQFVSKTTAAEHGTSSSSSDSSDGESELPKIGPKTAQERGDIQKTH